MLSKDMVYLKEMCKEVRRDIVRAIGGAGVGHIGGSLSIVETLVLLYFNEMNVDPKNPEMVDRDRLVLSKGHAGPALYSVLAEKGFFDKSWLDTLNAPGTRLPSHCDMNNTPGVDMTAGSLGQGFSCAVGMAQAAKSLVAGAGVRHFGRRREPGRPDLGSGYVCRKPRAGQSDCLYRLQQCADFRQGI